MNEPKVEKYIELAIENGFRVYVSNRPFREFSYLFFGFMDRNRGNHVLLSLIDIFIHKDPEGKTKEIIEFLGIQKNEVLTLEISKHIGHSYVLEQLVKREVLTKKEAGKVMSELDIPISKKAQKQKDFEKSCKEIDKAMCFYDTTTEKWKNMVGEEVDMGIEIPESLKADLEKKNHEEGASDFGG